MQIPNRDRFYFSYHAIQRYAERAGLNEPSALRELKRIGREAEVVGIAEQGGVKFRCANGCYLVASEAGFVYTCYWRGRRGERTKHYPTLSGPSTKIYLGGKP